MSRRKRGGSLWRTTTTKDCSSPYKRLENGKVCEDIDLNAESENHCNKYVYNKDGKEYYCRRYPPGQKRKTKCRTSAPISGVGKCINPRLERVPSPRSAISSLQVVQQNIATTIEDLNNQITIKDKKIDAIKSGAPKNYKNDLVKQKEILESNKKKREILLNTINSQIDTLNTFRKGSTGGNTSSLRSIRKSNRTLKESRKGTYGKKICSPFNPEILDDKTKCRNYYKGDNDNLKQQGLIEEDNCNNNLYKEGTNYYYCRNGPNMKGRCRVTTLTGKGRCTNPKGIEQTLQKNKLPEEERAKIIKSLEDALSGDEADEDNDAYLSAQARDLQAKNLQTKDTNGGKRKSKRYKKSRRSKR